MSLVIIGSGHNALAAAFYLARAGRKPIVLERREEVGGGAITGEVHPGFRCPTLTHEVLLHERIMRDMDLRRHGVELIAPDVDVFAPAADGPGVLLYPDSTKTMAALRAINLKDAAAWPEYRAAIGRVVSVLAPLLEAAPPRIETPGARDLLELLKAGRRFRGLGHRDAYRLLRWLPMPVRDLVDEWFESEPLRAAVAAPGVSGLRLGPGAAGSGLLLLLREAHARMAGGRTLYVRGGPGVLTAAMAAAARAAGAEIRVGQPVDRIVTSRGQVMAVMAGGRELPATTVVSSADPRTTLLELLEPGDLGPELATRARNYRASGTIAKVNLALSALPAFPVNDTASLTGRIHLGPSLDYMERAADHAKYGEISLEPWLDVRIPSLLDPSLVSGGGHVMSIYAHCSPHNLKQGLRAQGRETILQNTLAVLERFAPGMSTTVVATQVIPPEALEGEYGLAGGHVFHGELSPDQLLVTRPLIGYARYNSPIRGLHLCGAGTHPGGFLTGTSGRLAAEEILATG
jgi:phytoene dehydrogenase-like protein